MSTTEQVTTTVIRKDFPVNTSIQTVQPQYVEVVQNPLPTNGPSSFPDVSYEPPKNSGISQNKTVETVKTTYFTDGSKKEEKTVESVHDGITPLLRETFDITNQNDLERKLQQEKNRRGLA